MKTELKCEKYHKSANLNKALTFFYITKKIWEQYLVIFVLYSLKVR